MTIDTATDDISMTDVTKAAAEDPMYGVSADTARQLLRDMLLYRRFEEKAEEAYAIGRIGGFCHLHIGQEGVAAGCIAPLRKTDYAITAYREHTQAIAKGIDPKAVMAELFGRANGCSGGKGGSMHLFDTECRFMGGHGIVGGQVPMASGLAFSIKYRELDELVICFMGDAAVNQGGFHEAMNMSAIWDLPAIYVVENNAYGMGTAFSRVSRNGIHEKALSYAVPTTIVDGQNVLQTYSTFSDLADKVRGGEGPQFVDVRTYRFKGHSMSDPVSGTYRSKEEVDGKVEEQDPIAILRNTLLDRDELDQAMLEEFDGEAKQTAQDAYDFAEESPVPEPDALYRDVYREINPNGRLFFDGLDRPDFAK